MVGQELKTIVMEAMQSLDPRHRSILTMRCYDQLSYAEIAGLMDWLRENIHQHGRALSPSELVLRATGRKLDHQAFVRYASDKFSDLYRL